MARSRMSTLRVRAALVAGLVVLAGACSDSTGPRGPLPPKGVVVLNAVDVTGLTLADPSGGAKSFIAFGDNFDGGGMVVERDTVLSTSSALKGDLLWVADLRSGAVKTIQMPSGSDPSNAAFL